MSIFRPVAPILCLLLFLNCLLPVFCEQKKETESGEAIRNMYIIRYVLAKLIFRIMTIMETVTRTNVDISLKVEAQDALEELNMLLLLLSVHRVAKNDKDGD